MTNNQRKFTATMEIATIIAAFLLVAGGVEIAARDRQADLEQSIMVDEPDQLRPVDYQVCASVRNGELESRRVKSDPYGRKKDVA